MNTLIYPGSFDPVTLGHINIAVRGAALADNLIIAVLDNPSKSPLFTVHERQRFWLDSFDYISSTEGVTMDNVEVTTFSGLLAEFARERGANAILRGVRNAADFEVEQRYAIHNGLLSACMGDDGIWKAGIETIFLSSNLNTAHIASSIVKEIIKYATTPRSIEEVSNLVPPSVFDALKRKFHKV